MTWLPLQWMICEISILRLKCVVFLHRFLLLEQCSFVAFITPLVYVSSQLRIKFLSTPFRCMRACMYNGEVVFVNWKSALFVFKPRIYIPVAFFVDYLSTVFCSVVTYLSCAWNCASTHCMHTTTCSWLEELVTSSACSAKEPAGLECDDQCTPYAFFDAWPLKSFGHLVHIEGKAGGNWNSFLLLLPLPSLLVPNYLWKEPLFS